ncbi:MAG: 2-phospho-L-lactate guanylyltransferase [Acidobacteriota bacterium]|nr:MAG: 2-phospho-L-lactate guanylyltransferase [Acidobacteriota bacterium]
MRYILIPVKDLSRAKQRLAGIMTQEERTRLAWSMLETTFAAAAGARGIDGVAIVTLYPPAIELGRRYGFEIIPEQRQISESDSVDYGSIRLAEMGVEAVLRLPIDLPLIKSEDIEAILDQDPIDPGAVLAPSRDGTGTNAILRRPPGIFPSRFGPHSLSKHTAEAAGAGIACRLIELPRIALDLDDEADIATLLRPEFDCPTRNLLIGMQIDRRI